MTDDCDGSVATSGDRSPAGNFSVTLVQGATTVATRQTDASGNYSFGYLESGSYDVVIAPAGGSALDATAGVGGSGQTRVSAFDLQVNLTNAQTSSANNFIVTSTHALPAIVNLSPATKLVGEIGRASCRERVYSSV